MKPQPLLLLTLATIGILTRPDSCLAGQEHIVDWPFYAYNFGGLSDLGPAKQVDTLSGYGYDGISLTINNRKEGLIDISEHLRRADELPDFKVFSVFFRYNFDEPEERRSSWRKAMDSIAGRDIGFWFVFGRPHPGFDEAHIEQVLREVIAYAEEKDQMVTIYPHHGDVIPTAEKALEWINRIGSDRLDLVVHSCHELRSGNGDRIEEVLYAVRDRLAWVTIAGADKEIDFTNPISIEHSSIKPLYRGNFDNRRILVQLKKQGYSGSIGFINHLIKEDPDVYLSKTLATYKGWLEELNAPGPAYDAPDQVLWHAPTRQWFVSNLGGGISLAEDGYGWICLLAEDGAVLDPRWITGLDAPSGMIHDGDHLYVCDRAGVHQVDIAAGRISDFFPIPEGEFLNDIAIAANGDLYVSDFFGNRIYRLPADTRQAEVFLETPALETPDGLYMEEDRLIVVSWGVLSDKATFATSRKGRVLSVDLVTRAIQPLLPGVPEVGNLEGVTKARGAYYITDWMSGEILRVSKKHGREVFASGFNHPTDPDYAPELGVLGFPQHGTNQVVFINLTD